MPNRLDDLTGAVFGRWTVIADAGANHQGNRLWRCRCSCHAATERVVRASKLRDGRSASCGCARAERSAPSLFIDYTKFFNPNGYAFN